MSDTSSLFLPYQQRWIADQSPVKIAEKSRRVGLTWAEAADDALYAASESGDDVMYVGYNKDIAIEFIETCAMWAKAFSLAAAEIEDAGDVLEQEDKDAGILALKIRFASGHKIVALSSKPRNLRGRQGRVVLDEFAFHPDQAELRKAALALLMWGGSVRIISTHDGVDNPFNELIGDVRSGKVPYSLHRITFDDALADGLYQKICEKLGKPWSVLAEGKWRDEIIAFYGDGADEELFCIPRSSGGSFIPGALLEARMADIPVVRWAQTGDFAQRPEEERTAAALEFCVDQLLPLLELLDPKLMSAFGEDFGRSGDLTVIWPLQIRADLVRVPPFVLELRNIPFRQQEQILFFVVDRLPRFYAGALDARGNGQYLAEVAMQRYGAERIAQVMLSPAWYLEHMPRYKASIEDGQFVLPRHADIKEDHRAIRVERGIPRVPETARSKGTDGGQRHADSAIAGCLADAASRMDVVEYDYTPAARASAAAGDRPGDRDDIDDALVGAAGLFNDGGF